MVDSSCRGTLSAAYSAYVDQVRICDLPVWRNIVLLINLFLHGHKPFHSEWVPIVLAYAQENWGVRMNLDWKRDLRTPTNNVDDDDDRQIMIAALWKAWEQRLNDLCTTVEPCPGAMELVEGLRALNFPMAIATSSRMDSVTKKRLRWVAHQENTSA